METKEFVQSGGSIFQNGNAVVDVEITAKLKCKCGKEVDVPLEVEYEHGYYAGEGEIIYKLKCPHCNTEYERNEY